MNAFTNIFIRKPKPQWERPYFLCPHCRKPVHPGGCECFCSARPKKAYKTAPDENPC